VLLLVLQGPRANGVPAAATLLITTTLLCVLNACHLLLLPLLPLLLLLQAQGSRAEGVREAGAG
jgi:hypothetical protein